MIVLVGLWVMYRSIKAFSTIRREFVLGFDLSQCLCNADSLASAYDYIQGFCLHTMVYVAIAMQCTCVNWLQYLLPYRAKAAHSSSYCRCLLVTTLILSERFS